MNNLGSTGKYEDYLSDSTSSYEYLADDTDYKDYLENLASNYDDFFANYFEDQEGRGVFMPTAILAEAYCFCRVLKNLASCKIYFFYGSYTLKYFIELKSVDSSSNLSWVGASYAIFLCFRNVAAPL